MFAKVTMSIFVLAVALATIFQSYKSAMVILNGTETTGRVVSVETFADEDGTTEVPTIEYEWKNGGEKRRFAPAAHYDEGELKVGDVVPVRISRTQIGDEPVAMVDRFGEIWVTPIALGLITVLSSLFTLGLIFRTSGK